MKNGLIHQIDGRVMAELEKTMVTLNDAGHALVALHNVLIEIDIVESSEEEFLHLKTSEKHKIQTAMRLLGEFTTRETYRLPERLGLEYPC